MMIFPSLWTCYLRPESNKVIHISFDVISKPRVSCFVTPEGDQKHPGGLVARIWRSHCRGKGSIPHQGWRVNAACSIFSHGSEG